MNAPIAGKNGFSWLLDVIVCAVSRLILAVNNKRAYFCKKGYESVIFFLRRARPEIRRHWTCSRPHTYMHHTDP
jgi:hypothetical protein